MKCYGAGNLIIKLFLLYIISRAALIWSNEDKFGLKFSILFFNMHILTVCCDFLVMLQYYYHDIQLFSVECMRHSHFPGTC